MRQSSIVMRIGLALGGMVFLVAATMLTSYWISDKADQDAAAINMAGSLRMQSYRLGLLFSQSPVDQAAVLQAEEKLASTWAHPLFASLALNNKALAAHHEAALAHWRDIVSRMRTSPELAPALLAEQIRLLDALVTSIQNHAETNARQLRLVQVSALFLILLLSAVVIYWLKVKVELPLGELTQVAKRIGLGDFNSRVPPREMDELGLLAQAINRMSQAIAHMHDQMGEKIQQQTQALQRSNTTLQFLYDTAKSIIENAPSGIDYDRIVSRLAELIEAQDVELCLMTEAGETPYLQIKPAGSEKELCAADNCFSCLKGEIIRGIPGEFQSRYSFPMLYEQQHYGVLVCRLAAEKQLDHWQEQLAQSVADQLAVALSLQTQEDNARRLSLIHERTVIARELHDSLAQALSYLKIQVTRLNRALQKDDKLTMEDVSAELQEGLNTAYRQLRELLTTFRLKIEGPGLLSALQTSIKQLSEQTDMRITLDYQLSKLPLTPNEEIHLAQIIREASQNAIHHSQGKEIVIRLTEAPNKRVELSIEDDGIGIPEKPEKRNHYGLAIMLERGKNLSGELSIRRRAEGGTGVYFGFFPEYLQQRNLIARQG